MLSWGQALATHYCCSGAGYATHNTMLRLSTQVRTDTYDSEGSHVPYHRGVTFKGGLVVKRVKWVWRGSGYVYRGSPPTGIATVVWNLVCTSLVEVEATSCRKNPFSYIFIKRMHSTGTEEVIDYFCKNLTNIISYFVNRSSQISINKTKLSYTIMLPQTQHD